MLILVWFERSFHSAQGSRQSCPWPLKLMMSQAVEGTCICTGSLRLHLEPVMKHLPLFLTSRAIPVIIVSCFFTHLSLSQEYMPLPPGEEEEKSSDQNSEPKLQFSYVECLIFAFHQLAKKV